MNEILLLTILIVLRAILGFYLPIISICPLFILVGSMWNVPAEVQKGVKMRGWCLMSFL